MTSLPLTPRQLADIVFQRPGRVTEGILEKRGFWEKTRDSWLTWNDTSSSDAGWDQAIRKSNLLLQFTRVAEVKEEHPRSLKNAMLELKAFGYSNAQVAAIKEDLQNLCFGMAQNDHMELPSRMKKDYPGMIWGLTDGAFLGLGAYKTDLKNFRDQKAGNTILKQGTEDMIYAYFLSGLERKAASHVGHFTPAHPKP